MESLILLNGPCIIDRYGGTMLGPVRFQHIETCTREVCQLFRSLEQVEEEITVLESLDEEISILRAELGRLTNPDPIASISSTPTPSNTLKKQDYTASLLDPRPDVAKAQRLVRARRGTINSLKSSIQRHKTSPPGPASPPP